MAVFVMLATGRQQHSIDRLSLTNGDIDGACTWSCAAQVWSAKNGGLVSLVLSSPCGESHKDDGGLFKDFRESLIKQGFYSFSFPVQDGGGLFKDFMESLIKQGFHTQYGLFTANAQNELYPSPASFELIEDAPRLLEFLGCMLGKAMYEGILLELPLARFFLKKFRGGTCDLNDLPSLDDELYENLQKLRQSPGVVSDLGLVFTATRQVYGRHEDVDLKPGGRDIPVTPENAVEYIHRIADFRLNKELRGPCNAFLSGFFMMIQPEWIAMFNEEELQTLISGRMEEGLDLEDLRAHTGYAGGYHEEHPVILGFWSVLSTFSPDQQREFLRFVTACSRAPLLGFKYLEPQFCIQMAGSVLDPSSPERLPTAATCMNLLKLPPYRAPKVLREKLLYAISSAHGFDLS
ncbi:hypothetical protein DUNSADRAFT_10170 [Dunaliella salina]|uniref:HECT-type E3 ubiquitin transferase n=1 Tax=Dunaliella salina TaxID=3046 RepID=A0ABQ7GFZ6_DUNSA|nr:hypothetical protein DUNSADRAFT_10170 [Dunaliella salina]|eukprot:KAF5833519.1 hypothetical protein DUNSADRAFT_10170 [Dunaliella salina]